MTLDHDVMLHLLKSYGIDTNRVQSAHFNFHVDMPTKITVEYAGCKLPNGVKAPRAVRHFKITEE